MRRSVELDRNGDEPEREREATERAWCGHLDEQFLTQVHFRLSLVKAFARLWFRLNKSCQRSPLRTKRSAPFITVKSPGSAASSSSQVKGMEIGAPGIPRGEKATFRVLPRTFML